jgi:hypothetical protein
VDPHTPGTGAPIVVLKFNTTASLATLATDPSRYADLNALNDDGHETVSSLNALIATAISRAGSDAPDAPYYAQLKDQLTSPEWTGVLVFNASEPALPADVLGHSTGPLANTPVSAFDIGFTVPRTASSVDPVSSFFATLDLDGTSWSQASASSPDLLALFQNTELTRFAMDPC